MNSAKYLIRQRVKPTVAPLTAAVALGLSASNVQAATITVDNLADGTVAGQCTLRDAFAAANTDTAIAGCAAGSGPDSIRFQAGLTGTLNLGSPELVAESVISVAGPGSGQITISGQNNYRLFGAYSPGAELSISGLTLADAYTNDLYGGSAASALSGASLSLNDCVVSGNAAGGGSVGGAVAAFYSELTISDCLFTGNSIDNTLYRGGGGGGTGAAIGGAVLSWGSSIASISDSTFIQNQAGYAGGALAFVESPTALIINSEITENDANFGGGVAALRQSQVSMYVSTLSGNTAFAGGGAVVVSGSELTGEYNDVVYNQAQYDGGGVLVGTVYNGGGPIIASGGSAPDGTTSYLVAGDGFAYLTEGSINGNVAQRYGGGMAAKYTGSLAVTAYSDVSFNQAGFPPMPVAAQGRPPTLQPAGGGGGGGIYGGGGGMAALYDGAVYAYFDTTLYGNEASQGGALMGFQGAVFAVQATISGNYAEYGGGLQAGSANAPSPRGGATSGQAVALVSQITQNEAFAGGGVMAIYGGYAGTVESDITNNIAAIGGGMAAYNADFFAKYSNVSDNTGVSYGGGIAGIGPCPDSGILYSTLSGNDTEGNGGGVSLLGCGAEITYSLVTGNEAYAGGGLYMIGSPGAVPQLVNSTITGNTAAEAAGVAGDAILIRSSTISHNTASGPSPRGTLPPSGGALLASNSGTLRVDSSIFSDNVGGGVPSDLTTSGSGTTYFDYSLVEAPVTLVPPGTGNLTGVDPSLGPLADNGGTSLTRAIPQSSPAVDAGNPSLLLTYDQRGEPWPRAFNGRADMGAFEFFADTIFSDRFEQP